jgi:hypothetical protein
MPITSKLNAIFHEISNRFIALTGTLDEPIYVPWIAGQGAPAAAVLTGTTLPTELASCTIPGGTIGPNGSVLIEAIFSAVGGAGNKVVSASFGTYPLSTGVIMSVANVQGRYHQRIHNVNEATQRTHHPATGMASPGTGNPMVSMNQDTTKDVTVSIQAQLASAADSIRLEAWCVTVYPGF